MSPGSQDCSQLRTTVFSQSTLLLFSRQGSQGTGTVRWLVFFSLKDFYSTSKQAEVKVKQEGKETGLQNHTQTFLSEVFCQHQLFNHGVDSHLVNKESGLPDNTLPPRHRERPGPSPGRGQVATLNVCVPTGHGSHRAPASEASALRKNFPREKNLV